MQELDNEMDFGDAPQSEEWDDYDHAAVGAGLGGGFENTAKLKPMKHNEAINGPDKAKQWQKAVDAEHNRMKKFGAWVMYTLYERSAVRILNTEIP
jgi:hypothetical protein